MKIKAVELENFRGFRNKTRLEFNDLTAIVGKNDVGKSSWLEALDIFFGCEVVKIEKEDGSVLNGIFSESFSITISFLPPEELIIDASSPTNLKEEFLLDRNDLLTIKKKFKNGKEIGASIIAFHPINKGIEDLLNLKIEDLKLRAQSLGVRNLTDERKAASWRRAIRDSMSGLKLEISEIPIDQEGLKDIKKQIDKYMPIYGLFQVDRKNHDQDGEVQDPLKFVVKEVLADPSIAQKLQDIKDEIIKRTNEIADETIQKLNSMNPELAKHLQTDFRMKAWDTIFNPTIQTDNGIPLNKRGSGFRRMVLINFFRVQAEKRLNNLNQMIVYGLEEPETSQHPSHQQMLVEALQKLSEQGIQIIFTTHSPQIIKNIRREDIRYISLGRSNHPEITIKEDILENIVDDLGILPGIFSKLLICLEGENDISFLKNINSIPELKSIIDLNNVTLFPLNGGFLQKWVKNHYLNGAEIKEVHVYDSDNPKYKNAADEVNKWNNCSAYITNKLEIENYVHPDFINAEFGTNFKYDKSWDKLDLPVLCEQKTGKDQKEIKSIICGQLSKKMTKPYLEDIQAWDEVRSWFEKFAEAYLV